MYRYIVFHVLMLFQTPHISFFSSSKVIILFSYSCRFILTNKFKKNLASYFSSIVWQISLRFIWSFECFFLLFWISWAGFLCRPFLCERSNLWRIVERFQLCLPDWFHRRFLRSMYKQTHYSKAIYISLMLTLVS